jgi:hypothetical protein
MKKLLILSLALMLVAPLAWAPSQGNALPPGWAKGLKIGWQGQIMPPGLMKKTTQEWAPKMAPAEFYLLTHEFIFDAQDNLEEVLWSTRAAGKLCISNNDNSDINLGDFCFDFKATNVDEEVLTVNSEGEYALVFVPDLSQNPATPPDLRTVVVLGLTTYKKFTGKKDPLRNMEFQVLEGCCSNIKFPFPTQVSDAIPFHLQGSFFLVTYDSLPSAVKNAIDAVTDYQPGAAFSPCLIIDDVNWREFNTILYPTLQVRAAVPPDDN